MHRASSARPVPAADPKVPAPAAPGPDEPPVPAGTETFRRDPLREMALKDPAVQLFVNKLKGRMGMVEGAGPGKDKEE